MALRSIALGLTLGLASACAVSGQATPTDTVFECANGPGDIAVFKIHGTTIEHVNGMAALQPKTVPVTITDRHYVFAIPYAGGLTANYEVNRYTGVGMRQSTDAQARSSAPVYLDCQKARPKFAP